MLRVFIKLLIFIFICPTFLVACSTRHSDPDESVVFFKDNTVKRDHGREKDIKFLGRFKFTDMLFDLSLECDHDRRFKQYEEYYNFYFYFLGENISLIDSYDMGSWASGIRCRDPFSLKEEHWPRTDLSIRIISEIFYTLKDFVNESIEKSRSGNESTIECSFDFDKEISNILCKIYEEVSREKKDQDEESLKSFKSLVKRESYNLSN